MEGGNLDLQTKYDKLASEYSKVIMHYYWIIILLVIQNHYSFD